MNMKALMQQAKAMQKKMAQAEDAFTTKTFDFESQGIKVTLTGDKRMESITIDKDLIDPEDKDMLEDMMKVAINQAMDYVDTQKEKEVGGQMPSMPGMGGFGF